MKKLTDNQITELFKSKGLTIEKINEKGESTNGMTLTINAIGNFNYWCSFNEAYIYFTKMNWL